ncbi:MAG: DUF5320 domain-containing protein [Pseudomonadota bacterium]
MPGYDGTGPRGTGPMTGNGRGYCMLKIPPACNGTLTGFAGLAGHPVSLLPVSSWANAVFPRRELCQSQLTRLACCLRQIGQTCCGREARCGKSPRIGAS